MPLRPYQRKVLRSILVDYRAGIRRLALVMATGAGKTEVVSRLPEMLKQPKDQQLVFIVNRDDLVEQAAATYLRTGVKVGIERGQDRGSPESDDVVVMSIQSVSRKDGVDARMLRYNVDRIQNAVIDETHFALSQMYIHLLRYLRMLKGDPGTDDAKFLLGITATPDRTDGKGLEAIYDKVTDEVSPEELMRTGPIVNGEMYTYLARPKGFRVNTDFDMSMVRTRGGDFVDQDLEDVFSKPEYNSLILDKYEELGEGFPAGMFATSVKHAHEFAELANFRGIPAAAVDGSTPRAKRRQIYDALTAGDLRIISSRDVLTYGWDCPAATVALMARPIKSSLLYRQIVGRFLRRSPSVETYQAGGFEGWVKPYSIVIDFCGLLGKHSMVTVPTLFGLPSDFDFKGADAVEVKEEIEQIMMKYPTVSMRAGSLQEFKSQVDSIDVMSPPVVRPDVRKYSAFSWLEIFEGVLQLGTSGCTIEIRQNTLGLFEIYEVRQGIRQIFATMPTLKDALACGDSRVPQDEHALHKTRARWREEPPTEKQCARIYRLDQRVRSKFEGVSDFYAFALQQHNGRNVNYSKGAMSRAIDMFKQRETTI